METFMEAVQHKTVSIYDLTPSPENYNTHPQEQLEELKASLRRYSQVEDIVVKALPDGKYKIVAHEGVTTAALQLLESGECQHLEQCSIAIVPNSWNDLDVKGYMVTSNQTPLKSEPDDTALAQLLQEQQDAGFDLASLGTDDEYLRQLMEELKEPYFEPASEDDQGRLDEKAKVECPECGALFEPK